MCGICRKRFIVGKPNIERENSKVESVGTGSIQSLQAIFPLKEKKKEKKKKLIATEW